MIEALPAPCDRVMTHRCERFVRRREVPRRAAATGKRHETTAHG